MALRVLLAGGGTAGHTSPLLATAMALQRLDPEVALLCLGTEQGLEARLVPEAGYELATIPRVPLPRRLTAELFTVPVRLGRAYRATRRHVEGFAPDVVVGFGGYVSVPAYLVARRRGTPVVVHEQNALPGIANRLGARRAARVAVTFPDTPLGSAPVHTGLPLRPMIADLAAGSRRADLRAEARAFFDLDPGLPTLLVTGGSQGARRVNAAVLGAADALAAAGVQVLHVVGPKNETAAPETAVPYRVLPYVDRMDLALAAADLAVGRAGASSVIETAAVGLPAVFVPLPIGNGEQRRNAAPVVAAEGALLVEDPELTADWIAATVPALIHDTARLAAMGRAARGVAPADGADRLARLIAEAAHGGGTPR